MIRFADLLYSAFFQSAKNAAITKRASITLITFYSIRTSTKCIKTVITSETDNTLGLCIAYSKKIYADTIQLSSFPPRFESRDPKIVASTNTLHSVK